MSVRALKTRRWIPWTLGCAAAAVPLAAAVPAGAAVVFQTNFDQPTFMPGELAGQNGWTAGPDGGASVVIGGAQNTVQAVRFLPANGSNFRNVLNPFGVSLGNVVTLNFSFCPDLGWASNPSSVAAFSLLGPQADQVMGVTLAKDGVRITSPSLNGDFTAFSPQNMQALEGGWHSLQAVINLATGVTTLKLDGNGMSFAPPGGSFVPGGAPRTVTTIGLSHQGQFTPDGIGGIRFDAISVDVVPAPAAWGVLLFAAAGVRRRR